MSVNLDSGEVISSGNEEEKNGMDNMEIEKEIGDFDTGWNEELRLVLVGKTGSGKSTSGNTILGQKQFLSRTSASSVTQICQLGSTEVQDVVDNGQTVTQMKRRRVVVVDMPGFGDTRLSVEQIHTEIAKCVSLSAPGPHAFLFVVPIGRYTDSENQAVCELIKIFGEDAVRHHTVVLFTRGDDLEGTTIEEYLRETAPASLEHLIDRCRGRYHVLNNKDPSNSTQVKELLIKVDKMVRQTAAGFYTNAMFSQAEAAIREEQERMLMQGKQREGEEWGSGVSVDTQYQFAKWRESDLESDRAGGADFGSQRIRKRDLGRGNEENCKVGRRGEESRDSSLRLRRDRGEPHRDRSRGRCSGSSRAVSRRQSLSSFLNSLRREAALSPKVLDKIKILVAAGATGMAVGAVFGAAAPLAAAAGASLMGNSVGFAAGQFAGVSVAGGTGVGKAVGAIVAAASGKSAVALGAATGGVLGGSVGAIAGAEAASPQEAALDALGQVSVIGASAVGLAAGVGGGLGAGVALGAALDGAVLSTAALSGAEAASVEAAGVVGASVAQSSVASAAGAVATAESVAAGAATPQCAVAGAALAPEMAAVSSGALCRSAGAWHTVAATTRILSAVADIGKAATAIALAGGLVVKVVKEKVRRGTGTTEATYSEKKSYKIYWNKNN